MDGWMRWPLCDLAVPGAQTYNLNLISELLRQLMLCSLTEHEEFCRSENFPTPTRISYLHRNTLFRVQCVER